jgi:hypothetical protein
MTMRGYMRYLLVFGFLFLPAVSLVAAGPLDELLPPPVRQMEKRSLGIGGGEDMPFRRNYYDGRGIMNASFSPDGKFLVTSAGFPGMALWDVASGRSVGTFPLGQGGPREGSALAFTPDGKQMVTATWGSSDGNPVALYDVARRTRVRSLDEDANDVPFMALSVAPNGKTVALAPGFTRRNEALDIAIWDLASGDQIGHIGSLLTAQAPAAPPAFPIGPRGMMMRGGGGIEAGYQALAHSPDGRTLAVLMEGRVALVELATGRPRAEFTWLTNTEVRPMDPRMARFAEFGMPRSGALAFTPDGGALAVGCSDGAIRRFDLRTGQQLAPLPGHVGSVVALCYPPDGKVLHSYGSDGQFCVWRSSALRDWKPKAGPLGESILDSLWDALRSDDPLDLYGCLETLGASPAEVVPFLSKRLVPVVAQDAERIEQLIAEAQKRDYNTRKKAIIELRKIGAPAAPILRRVMDRGGDESLRKLQGELESLTPVVDQTRTTRALAVLERIGTAEARQLLEKLANGAADAELTIQAKAALERVKKVTPSKTELSADALWETLASDDPVAAYRAIRTLSSSAVPPKRLAEQMQEVTSKDTFNDDPQRVAKLLKDLDSDDLDAREQAGKSLRNLGRLAIPALRKALEAKPSAEVAKSLEGLLEEATKGAPPPELLRLGRALEALEMMARPEARQALEVLGKVRNQWLSEAATDSLRRQQGKNQ